MKPFPVTSADPARYPGPPPASADVVVIGGGIIGIMAAWHLARQGQGVTLCEKGRVAGEQSSRNWGWIRQQGRDPAELPLMVESLALWRELARDLGPELGFRQKGVAYLANVPDDLARFEAWLTHARKNAIDSRLLTRAEVATLYPGTATAWLGGLLTPSDGSAEPAAAMAALAADAARQGVRIVENCAVRALDRAEGRLAGVITEQGRIASPRVVLAGGAWSGLLARAEGVNLPQLSVRASVALTAPMPDLGLPASGDARIGFRQRADGRVILAERHARDAFIGPDAFRHLRAFLPTLRHELRRTALRPAAPAHFPDAWTTPRRWTASAASPFEAMRSLDPAPNRASLDRAAAAFVRTFPRLGHPGIEAAWAGMIDTLPDGLPVIDHVASLPGLTLATGFAGHGFGIGPGVGRVLADLVMGNPPGHDLSAFRLARFAS